MCSVTGAGGCHELGVGQVGPGSSERSASSGVNQPPESAGSRAGAGGHVGGSAGRAAGAGGHSGWAGRFVVTANQPLPEPSPGCG